MPRLSGLPANIAAFLDTLAWSEGAAQIPGGDDGYGVLVGATPARPWTFSDYSRHPNLLNQALDSTAAGRYQIIHPTWLDVQRVLQLPDFGPESQDKAACELMRRRGAWGALLSGDLPAAVAACANEWASLPGGTSGQHEQRYNDLQQTYLNAGGRLAQPGVTS